MTETARSRRLKLPPEVRKRVVDAVKGYFLTEREEELGDLAAGLLVDFFVEQAGPAVYNQALADAQKFMSEKVEDLASLEKP